MCTNYMDLTFHHFVVAADGTIFASGREGGRTYNFLIRDGCVQGQSGEQWIELNPSLAELVRNRVELAYGSAPIYRTEELYLS